MMESNRQWSERGTPGPVFPPYEQRTGAETIGGASEEITSTYMSVAEGDMPPDPMYGDVVDERSPYTLPANVPPVPAQTGQPAPERPQRYVPETDEGVVYAPRPVEPTQRPAERDQRSVTRDRPTAVTQTRERLPERPIIKGAFAVLIDGAEKHRLTFTAREPQTQLDDLRLVRAYFEAVRERGRFDNAVEMNEDEQAYYSMYCKAQMNMTERLGVAENTEYDVNNTPYHVFTSMAAMHAVVRRMESESMIRPGHGLYSPLTGALWVRTNDRAVMERGFARLAVESSAAFVGLPPASQREHKRPHEVGFKLNLGTGYARPDLTKDFLKNDGFNRAVTAMGTALLMREAHRRVEPHFHPLGINVVLDGVIRAAAERYPNPKVTQSVVAEALLKGYYQGDTQPINVLRQLFPDVGVARMLRMDGGEGAWDIQVIGRMLGVPDIYDRYHRIRSGEPAHLYEWDDEWLGLHGGQPAPRLPGRGNRQVGA